MRKNILSFVPGFFMPRFFLRPTCLEKSFFWGSGATKCPDPSMEARLKTPPDSRRGVNRTTAK